MTKCRMQRWLNQCGAKPKLAEDGIVGKATVKALQKKVGAAQDGFWGKDTSTKLQQWLKKKGYSLAVDGYFGHESVKALQKSLNDGKWS